MWPTFMWSIRLYTAAPTHPPRKKNKITGIACDHVYNFAYIMGSDQHWPNLIISMLLFFLFFSSEKSNLQKWKPMKTCFFNDVIIWGNSKSRHLPHIPEWPQKTANISQCLHWFPCKMTSEKQVQKFHTDLPCHYPDLSSVSDWLKIASSNQKRSGASSVWSFCTCFSDIISWENRWWHGEMLAVS